MYPIMEVTESTTAREVFLGIVEHLRRQGRRAWSNGCVNRTDDGRACAAACMLTDQESVIFGGISWLDASRSSIISPSSDIRPNRLKRFDKLLVSLQMIHDGALFVDQLNNDLINLALALGLGSFEPLKTWEAN